MIDVSTLYIYPIKSCRGTAVSSATLDARGLIGDRRFMIVDDHGRFLSQRELPRMALISPAIVDGVVTLAAPGAPSLDVPIADDGPRRDVVVWQDQCAAIDQGDAAGEWLGDFLQVTCRLVRLADYAVRRVDPAYATQPNDQVSFADGYPLLLIGEASLADLNARLPAPLPMNRFRPNVVVRGSAPYAEDAWGTVRIGAVRASVVKPCARCTTTTVDQETAERGKEPLRTLATYRRAAHGGVLFGQNLIHAELGTIHVGDPVTH
jgi:hypothetical protein